MENIFEQFEQIGLMMARTQFKPQIDEFAKLKGPNGEFMRGLYLFAFISTNARPVDVESIEELLGKPEEELKKNLHDVVNDTSLLGPEISFMNQMIDLDASSVQEYIELFEKVDRLPRCQNASGMKECLNLTKDLKLLNFRVQK